MGDLITKTSIHHPIQLGLTIERDVHQNNKNNSLGIILFLKVYIIPLGDKLLIPILLLLDHAIYLLLKHAKSMLHKVNNSGVQMRKPEEITIWTTLHLNY